MNAKPNPEPNRSVFVQKRNSVRRGLTLGIHIWQSVGDHWGNNPQNIRARLHLYLHRHALMRHYNMSNDH